MKNVTSPYLYIEKNSNAMGSYDDGIFIRFGEKKPQHITFSMYSENADIETCDLRLTTIENSTTNATTPVASGTKVSLPAQ